MEPNAGTAVGTGMSTPNLNRRDLLALAGCGGVVFASGLGGCARAASESAVGAPAAAVTPRPTADDFFFLQLSDTHWGYRGDANPEAAVCLKRTIERINAVEARPDFVVFTGDLTHRTEDSAERRDRMAEFLEIARGLKTERLVFLPGEHDAAADDGAAYHEHFGDPYQAFEHRGVHFITLDNATRLGGTLGDEQLTWLSARVAAVPAGAALVVLAHRPLFELFPAWDWATSDGARAVEVLSRHGAVDVFYGHIHQEHHRVTGTVSHHAARSLVFPLPAAGTAPKRLPLAWDPASSDHGLGHRSVRSSAGRSTFTEVPFIDAAASANAALTSL
ncbi:MAG TPA: metallophosphoesterase [Polyangiaceae bacterium]|jgi:3',5'-cyclic AMP phosphodiesterase CpdA|nr:metallophosphoesterase [Polyangiaceae bacterium]